MAVCIQCFALIFLSVRTKDPREVLGSLLGIEKFGAELLDEVIGLVLGLGKFLNGLLETCYSFVLGTRTLEKRRRRPIDTLERSCCS